MSGDDDVREGVSVAQVWVELLSAGQVEVRARLSDGSFLLLHRTDEDLAGMMKKLVDGFLDDRETLSSNLLTGLLRVRAADQVSDVQVKTVELNKLLQTIIYLPTKFSQSEAVLSFFRPSAKDQVFRQVQTFNKETNQPEDLRQVQSIRHEDKKGLKSFSHEDLVVHHSIGHEDQEQFQFIQHEADQVTGSEDHEKTESMRHEDKDLQQSIQSEDQDSVRSSGPEALEEVQTRMYEAQEVVQPLEPETQEKVQSTRREVQTEVQSIMHKVPERDQSLRPEAQEVVLFMRHEIQDRDQPSLHEEQDLNDLLSPLVLSEIWRSNGFCLANTETILIDPTPPINCVVQSEDVTDRRDDEQTQEEESEAGLASWPHPLHLLHTCSPETDILE
ncbi:nestin-like isoform X2 [Xyrichtys novacula]|uniref:Nestin-like isoform X2 n=1 Tax=Xyrichtys novacula TaxID=13765 RepID=A0AAV1GKM6_XYRNO|nr:nestin-like isoform X2 [Xyrichtys novacula]